MFTCLNAKKKHKITFLKLSSAAAFYSFCLKYSVFAPVSLRPFLLNTQYSSDWSAHTCLTQHCDKNRAALPNQFLCTKLAMRHK